jgi:hypothetical protein
MASEPPITTYEDRKEPQMTTSRTACLLLATALALTSAPPVAIASHYLVTTPTRVELQFPGRGQYKQVTVYATRQERDFARLSVKFDHHQVVVPRRELTHFEEPDLGTFQVRYDGEDPSDVYVYFKFGVSRQRSAEFHFKDGGYIGLISPDED